MGKEEEEEEREEGRRRRDGGGIKRERRGQKDVRFSLQYHNGLATSTC